MSLSPLLPPGLQNTPGVGLLVLSTTHTVLHTNEHATPMLARLRSLQSSDDPQEERPEIELPTTVRVVCEEAHQTLVDRSEQNDWQPFEISRTVGHADESIMVRAFVFPSRASLLHTRILVTLQQCS